MYHESYTSACPAGKTWQLFRISPNPSSTSGWGFETCVGHLNTAWTNMLNTATFDTEGEVMYVGQGNRISSIDVSALETSTNQPTTNVWCANKNSRPQINFKDDSTVGSLTGGGALGSDIVFSDAQFSSETTDHGYVVSIAHNCNLVYVYKDLASSSHSGILTAADQSRCTTSGLTGCHS